MFIFLKMFSLFFSFFFSRYFGVISFIPLVIFLLGSILEGVFWFSFENFFFIFLSILLAYILIKCSKLVSGGFYLIFFLIFYLFFSVDSLLLFFIFFELSLIPTYFLMMKGGTPERMLAGKYLILYTFIGSVPLLVSILVLGGGSFSVFFIVKKFKLYFLMIAFLMKLPIFLFHLWLPKAHVEASTEGSMILAGVLLKLGAFGLVIFCRFGEMSVELGLIIGFGGVTAGVFSVYQVDVKSLIAYSSVLHMGLFFLKSFYMKTISFSGVVFMSVGHGFISACMFFLLSIVYSFCGSRKIFFIGGTMSKNFSLLFFCGLCLVLNASAPLSLKFFGEYFLFLGASYFLGTWGFILILLKSLIGGLLSMYLFLSLFHGVSPAVSFSVSLQKVSVIFFLKMFSILFIFLF